MKHGVISMTVATALLLSGCGFHLKGQAGQSEQRHALSQAFWLKHPLVLQDFPVQQTAFASELRQQLDFAQIPYSRQGSEAKIGENNLVLQLSSPGIRVKQTAQSALGSTTAEFLRWQQTYQLLSSQGKLLSSGQIQSTRDRQLNPSALLAAEAERSEILRSMAEDLARQMVQRLQAYAITYGDSE